MIKVWSQKSGLSEVINHFDLLAVFCDNTNSYGILFDDKVIPMKHAYLVGSKRFTPKVGGVQYVKPHFEAFTDRRNGSAVCTQFYP